MKSHILLIVYREKTALKEKYHSRIIYTRLTQIEKNLNLVH
jgi:hypothetical protein